MTLREYYHTTMQEYYLKVESFNDKYYRELDLTRRIQFDIRRYSQMDHKCKPKKLSDIVHLPIDDDKTYTKRETTPITNADIEAIKKLGFNLINPLDKN